MRRFLRAVGASMRANPHDCRPFLLWLIEGVRWDDGCYRYPNGDVWNGHHKPDAVQCFCRDCEAAIKADKLNPFRMKWDARDKDTVRAAEVLVSNWWRVSSHEDAVLLGKAVGCLYKYAVENADVEWAACSDREYRRTGRGLQGRRLAEQDQMARPGWRVIEHDPAVEARVEERRARSHPPGSFAAIPRAGSFERGEDIPLRHPRTTRQGDYTTTVVTAAGGYRYQDHLDIPYTGGHASGWNRSRARATEADMLPNGITVLTFYDGSVEVWSPNPGTGTPELVGAEDYNPTWRGGTWG